MMSSFASLRTTAERNGVTCPHFVTYVAKFRDDLRTRDQRQLIAEQLAADSVSEVTTTAVGGPVVNAVASCDYRTRCFAVRLFTRS
jgi:hypothetical protein